MSYQATLNDLDDEDFTNDTENEAFKVKSIGKRKMADYDEESDDETSKKVRKSWSKEKTAKLLELVKLNQDKLLLDKRTRKTRVWKDILDELQYLDLTLTVDQVAKKWKNLFESYKKFVENMQTGANPRMKKPDFFETVGEIIRTENYSSFELSYSDPMILTSNRSLKEEDTDMDTSSCLETRLNSEQDLPEDNPSECPDGKREENRSRKNRSSTKLELVEKSIQQLVETNAKAITVDQMRLKFLETQTNREDNFDKDILEAFRERNLVTKRTSKYIDEFREILKKDMKLIKDIDARTKKMEKFIDTHFKVNAK